MKERYVVSACLLGKNCKYNGGNNLSQAFVDFLKGKAYIAVCPEQLGGLSSPRARCEIKEGSVIDEDGNDVTQAFENGANKALCEAISFRASQAIVQPRSPSCGAERIYSGNFDGCLIKGNGIFVQKLKEAGILVQNVDEWLQIAEEMKKKQKTF